MRTFYLERHGRQCIVAEWEGPVSWNLADWRLHCDHAGVVLVDDAQAKSAWRWVLSRVLGSLNLAELWIDEWVAEKGTLNDDSIALVSADDVAIWIAKQVEENLFGWRFTINREALEIGYGS